MSAPWLEVFLPLQMTPFVEKIFVHKMFIVRISLLFEQKVICKQCYIKSAKLMSVLKILKMHFSVKQAIL